jgi:hypothetical protein
MPSFDKIQAMMQAAQAAKVVAVPPPTPASAPAPVPPADPDLGQRTDLFLLNTRNEWRQAPNPNCLFVRFGDFLSLQVIVTDKKTGEPARHGVFGAVVDFFYTQIVQGIPQTFPFAVEATGPEGRAVAKIGTVNPPPNSVLTFAAIVRDDPTRGVQIQQSGMVCATSVMPRPVPGPGPIPIPFG